MEKEQSLRDGKVLWRNLITKLESKLPNKRKTQTKNQEIKKEHPMRSEFKVRINTIDRVKMFVNICNTFDDDIDLSHGRYMIDAKSLWEYFLLT